MKHLIIKNIGKLLFWISFLLGNICLFGYFITKNDEFAFGGFLLLIFGTIINLIAFLGLILYGAFIKQDYEECMKSALTILINIPIAVFYAWIGAAF